MRPSTGSGHRFVDVDPWDEGQVAALASVLERARVRDDPEAFPTRVENVRNDLRYGFESSPARWTLLDGDGDPVGAFSLDTPTYDNRHVVQAELVVRPDRRREGLGSRLLDEVVARTRALGRTTLWLGAADDDQAATAFLTGQDFTRASTDARRHQRLADVDAAEIDRLEADAAAHAAEYDLERIDPPYDDTLLAELMAATAAITDAPMGSLTHEPEVFDLDRMRDQARARQNRGERFRRVVARHRETREIGGHTYVVVAPWDPTHAYQGDTAVVREHRGHRLGLALKIAMMRWLAADEPQVEVVETWNNVDNTPMISVNEALGYRLSRVFATWERVLTHAP